MDFLILLVILLGVVLVLTGPLRAVDRRERSDGHAADRAGGSTPRVPRGDGGAPPSAELAELEAAREAKYREIRDAELDHATGKLSEDDFRQVEDRLRAEAVQILDGIEALAGRSVEELQEEGRPPK